MGERTRGSEGAVRKNLAQIGYKFFVVASRDYPVSVTAQAAYIAYSCKQNDFDPKKVWDDLVADKKLMKNLLDVANTMHRRFAPNAPQVTEKSLREILADDFSRARTYAVLKIEDLEAIFNTYPQFERSKEREEEYKLFVEDAYDLSFRRQRHAS